MAKQTFTLNINGRDRKVTVEPDEPLLWVLRDNFKLTGSKFGCGIGVCGACSVLINLVSRRSCRIPVSEAADGSRIVTIEGLGTLKKLSPLQQAFVDHTAFCCGFCTPGMIITATSLLMFNPHPSRDEIVAAMDRNLCRCGSYLNIIEAIEAVAQGKYSG